MTPNSPRFDESIRKTRHAIVEMLKREGPTEPSVLARELNVTPVAIRQHLYTLAMEGLVDCRTQSRPIGRPVKLWRLTTEGDSRFPDGHSQLVVDLIACVQETFGEKGLKRLLQARKRQMIQSFDPESTGRLSMRERVDRLAAKRTKDGYMSSAEDRGDGTLLLIVNHCAIRAASAVCGGFCQVDAEVFSTVLGDDIRLTRVDHIQAGDRRCAFIVEAIEPPTERRNQSEAALAPATHSRKPRRAR